MPWQQMVADVGGELLPGTRIPAYRVVVVTVPRQNGKTTLMLAVEVQRALGWGSPQRIAYTAQHGSDARQKFLDDQVPLLDPKTSPRLPVKAGVQRVYKGMGNESALFKNGSRIILLNSGEESGHGKTLDLAVIDEAFSDFDDRREGAVIPAMRTRQAAQLWVISTAGTEKSTYLKRKVDEGRAAVANGETTGTAYFEWSAPEDADIHDPATWYGCMPALGHTITEEVVRSDSKTETEGNFRRTVLNQWTVSDERVIPLDVWNAVLGGAAPDGKMALGLEVHPDRTSAALAVADSSGQCELIDAQQGLIWTIDGKRMSVVEYTAEVARKWDIPVVIDSYGPAAPLAPEIEALGARVEVYKSADMARACAGFYDAIADKKAKIRPDDRLNRAVAAASKRIINDMWIWGRKNAADDVAPLIAITIAHDKARALGHESDLWFFED